MFKPQNPCSNHEIHVPFEHGFWPTSLVKVTRRHVFHRNKMADVEEAPRFSVRFYVVNVIFKQILSGLE